MSEKQKLLDTFNKLRDALFAHDVQILKELMAKEYVGYDPHGNPQDLKMTLEAYQPGGAELDTYDVEEIETRVIGDVGIITGKGYIHGRFAECEFEHNLRFLDLYILRDGMWRLYISQVTPIAAQEKE
ncbi:MAG: nuclear transport factor 2 family protein [Bacteroidales bacterium]|nr:nuclear transport factor 2 family protein [Candidatus Latescibacterota bacterium]